MDVLVMDEAKVTASQVRSLIGMDDFYALLMELPDEFYDLRRSEEAAVWRRILRAVNRGERDVATLGRLGVVNG